MKHLLSLSRPIVIGGTAALLALGRGATAQTPRDHIAAVESGLLPRVRIKSAPVRYTLAERMRFYGIPGVSIAVVDSGRIVWAKGYGVKESGTAAPVDTATLFLAGSISKPVSSTGVLTLVDHGQLDFDTDVNTYLKSWKLPANALTRRQPVTLRALLSHTAGTTVHGFGGYPRTALLPTIPQVLSGGPPANSRPVVVDKLPGTSYRYSGGGIIIAQLVAMDVTGESFPDFMQKRVLGPFGMVHSTFENPLPERLWDRAASGHGSEGKVVEGKWVVYPEMAAAGLWTTASDLARWIIGIQRGYAGVDHPVLSAAMVHEMLTVQNGGPFGLGARLRGQGDSLYFLHNGTDEGFQAYVVGSVRGGNGAVVMTNSDQPGLIPEIVSAIASEYGWVGYLPPERDIVALDRKAMQKYVGSYQGAGGFQIAIEADQLFVLRPGDKQLLLMQRNGRMISVMGVEYSFELGPGGLVKGVILYSNEAETGRATRVPN